MDKDNIYVTKTFLPPMSEYQGYLSRVWESGQITNQGPLVQELQSKLRDYLNVTYLHFVANGTLALQVALRALELNEGEIITTPFSYVATTSSILWERCKPVFVDIDPNTFCIDPNKIEEAITGKTKAIMPVHVFGYPCDIDVIDEIAKRYNLKVIYDAAHAFGVEYKGRSLLDYGDISICSFHATKLYHTIEGGCLITKDNALNGKIELIKRFGHNGDEHFMLGTNAKASELHAAMGLCNLKYTDVILEDRRRVVELYDALLNNKYPKRQLPEGTSYNYAYYPIVLEDEKTLLKIMENLATKNIFPRRYFYPSLNTLPYLEKKQACPISEDISRRILCLPLYVGLEDEVIREICEELLR